jgi:pimeloyl-ACP methyl ester carboxylesterase
MTRPLIAMVIVVAGLTGIRLDAQQRVSFPADDGWVIHGTVYGSSERGVVLIHGGRFTKESWQPQAQQLVKAGFRVLAIDLRGYGISTDGPSSLKTGFGSPLDALAAVKYLREGGAKTISIVGASMGADAAAGASIASKAGDIDRLVLLAGSGDQPGGQLKGRKLFIVTRNDANDAGPRLPKIRAQYEQAPEFKELLILDGDAHAQFIFATEQGDRLMRAILRFLSDR